MLGNVHFPASQLATITELDASNLGLTDLIGLDRLVNLESLDLSGNSLDSAALNILVPRTARTGSQAGDLLGTRRLQSLDLSHNAELTEMGSIVELSNLSRLNMEGTGVRADAIDAHLLRTRLPELVEWTLTVPQLSSSQNVVLREGETVSINVLAPSLWTANFIDLNGNITSIQTGGSTAGSISFSGQDDGTVELYQAPIDFEDGQLDSTCSQRRQEQHPGRLVRAKQRAVPTACRPGQSDMMDGAQC